MKTESTAETMNQDPKANDKPDGKNPAGAIEKISRAGKILERTAPAIAKVGRPEGLVAIERERSQLASADYKIGVVGAFKSGKSTLINAAFLGQEVLFSDPQEATCVATEISWSEEPRLEIFPYLEKSEAVDGSEEHMRIRMGEDEVIRIQNPSPTELKNETSATTPNEREYKARRISRVRYGSPIPTLRNLTVVDSPGIDSTSGAVVDAALRLVPACDTVLFVTTTKTGGLSQPEEEFLRSGVLEQGFTRLIVVLNHFEDQTPLSREGKRQHIETMKKKLESIGRGYLPVLMVDAKGWLDSQLSDKPTPQDAVQFEKDMRGFLDNELVEARAEKAVGVAQREIRSAMLELSATAALAKENRETREKLKDEIEKRGSKAKARLDQMKDNYLAEFDSHLRGFQNRIEKGLHELNERGIDRIRAAADLGELQKELRSLPRRLQPQVEGHYLEAAKILRKDIAEMQEKFETDINHVLSDLDARELIPGLGEDVALPPIPAPLVTLLDYLLVIVASPFPALLDVILRLLADRFPEVRKLMPTGLAKSMAQSWIENQLDRQTSEAIEQVDKQLGRLQDEAKEVVSAGVRTLIEAELEPIRKAIKDLDDDRPSLSEAEIQELKSELNTLSTEAREFIASPQK